MYSIEDTLAWTSEVGRERVKAVLEYAQSKLIAREGSSGFVVFDPVTNKNKQLKGLTPLMRSVFWPDQHHFTRTSKPTTLSRCMLDNRITTSPITAAFAGTSSNIDWNKWAAPKTSSVSAKPPKSIKVSDAGVKAKSNRRYKRSAVTYYTGARRGSYVHHQIDIMVKHGPEVFAKMFPDGCNDMTKRAMNMIVNHCRWRPFLCELAVSDKEKMVGTAVDIVCVDVEGNIQFVEVKTGYEGDRFIRMPAEGRSRYMRSPLNFVENCPLYQAMLQISMGVKMFQTQLTNPIPCSAWVLHIGNTSSIYRVEDDFIARTADVAHRALIQWIASKNVATKLKRKRTMELAKARKQIFKKQVIRKRRKGGN